MDEAPAGREPLPEVIRPMLAVAGELPRSDGWAYEYKWDGMRGIVYVEEGRMRIASRSGRDMTASFPELRAGAEALGPRAAVLDGEIVALGDDGRPSFAALQTRMQVADPSRAHKLAAAVPVTYMAFDVLHLDGRSTMAMAYCERRRLLEDLPVGAWVVPPSYAGAGADLLSSAAESGLEGVVAKRTDSPYRPGRRDAAWTKVKCFRTQEVVVGGWSAGRGRRRGAPGALLLGIPSPGGLDYVGKVGTGFTDAMLEALSDDLAGLGRKTSPFSRPPPAPDRAGVTWVEPELVGEVRFGTWTKEGRLRQASWRGLRPDKAPEDVVRE